MKKTFFISIALLFRSILVTAQVDSLKLNFDLRTRGELDNGVKALIPKGKSAETSVSSRARFGIDYFYKNLEIYFSAQDVRTWGETATTTSKNQNFTLHEAWANYQFTKNFDLKLGRQILSFDNERLVGALDWAMQGRSFDAIKGTYHFSNRSKLETVISYNNDNNDTNNIPNKEIYGISESGEINKSMQILHYQYSSKKNYSFSAIALNSILQNSSGKHYDMFTLGINTKKHFTMWELFGSFYYQTGKNTISQSKSAYQFSLNANYNFSSKLNTILGIEWLSGNNYDTKSSENKAFSPLYGTNHMYNGFMDYFFSGANYYNSYGLNDYYLKSNYKFNSTSNLQTDIHLFTSNGKIGFDSNKQKLSNYLGTELDLIFTKKIGQFIHFNLGQSFMFASKSLEYLNNVHNQKKLQSWTWLSVKINPKFKLI